MTTSSNTQEERTGCPPARRNRLAGASSPYLRQHAGNQVDWYPWGEEALRRAREENKPIFLSIGYSACHWCHVMERESFEDAETAELVNAHFVAIKVDREERPDLDEIYMTAVQLMTGQGGWPLSVFLTPDLKPFYGGTYFPPEDRFGMPSFKRLLGAVATTWQTQPGEVAGAARRMAEAIGAVALLRPAGAHLLDGSLLSRAVAELREQFDPVWGGFGGPPKFPPNAALALVLREYHASGDKDLLAMATLTLDRMASGGMVDQIGGGFHRYSVDAQWLVPHFEKMLCDNALLAKVYLEAWQASGVDRFRQVAAGIFDYVLRDMTDRCGGFHTAEDADSEGGEGRFYLWTPGEIKTVLGEKDGSEFCRHYGVSEQGNFEGSNILHVTVDPGERGAAEALGSSRERLLAERRRRARPAKDDKILASWNGMMISALARGYEVLGENRYLEAAERAAHFILATMVRDGTVLHTSRDSVASDLPGYLDDYAQVATSLVDLYEATFNPRWLHAADELAGRMIEEFWDAGAGGFYFASAAHENLLVRTKPVVDGAAPSGNSAAAMALLRLARVLDNKDYRQKAEQVLSMMDGRLREQPRAHLDLLCALDFAVRPGPEIAIIGPRASEQTRMFLKIIHQRFIPNKILALADPQDSETQFAGVRIPLLADKQTVYGGTTVYVCENFACKEPVTDGAALERLLEQPWRAA